MLEDGRLYRLSGKSDILASKSGIGHLNSATMGAHAHTQAEYVSQHACREVCLMSMNVSNELSRNGQQIFHSCSNAHRSFQGCRLKESQRLYVVANSQTYLWVLILFERSLNISNWLCRIVHLAAISAYQEALQSFLDCQLQGSSVHFIIALRFR